MKTTALSCIAAILSRAVPPVVGIQRHLILMPRLQATAGPLLLLTLVVGMIGAVVPARRTSCLPSNNPTHRVHVGQ